MGYTDVRYLLQVSKAPWHVVSLFRRNNYQQCNMATMKVVEYNRIKESKGISPHKNKNSFDISAIPVFAINNAIKPCPRLSFTIPYFCILTKLT